MEVCANCFEVFVDGYGDCKEVCGEIVKVCGDCGEVHGDRVEVCGD